MSFDFRPSFLSLLALETVCVCSLVPLCSRSMLRARVSSAGGARDSLSLAISVSVSLSLSLSLSSSFVLLTYRRDDDEK